MNARLQALFAAIDENDSECVDKVLDALDQNQQMLLLNERVILEKNELSAYPLEYAIKKRLPDMVRHLIHLGANVNIISKPEKSVLNAGSFLHLAAQLGDVEIIKILLKSGANRHWRVYCGYDAAKSCEEMPCTSAFEYGQGEAFIQAAEGVLTEHEALELKCIYHDYSFSLEAWVPENKIKMDSAKTFLSTAQKHHLCSKEMYEKFAAHFPPIESWRFFIDGELQIKRKENGWSGYEIREPGCMSTMYSGFEAACLNKAELTSEFVFKIHQKAMLHKAGFKDIFDDRAIYPLKPGENLSLLGYLELCSPPFNHWNELRWNKFYKRFNVLKQNGSKEDVDHIITCYNEAQKNTSSNDREQQLKNIILLASSYARLHPREDGNNRTAMILLNSELVKYGFVPVILENPNRLEGYSQKELLQEVYQGMRNTCHVMEHGYYPGGKSTIQLKQVISDEPQKNIPDAISHSFKMLTQTWQKAINEYKNEIPVRRYV